MLLLFTQGGGGGALAAQPIDFPAPMPRASSAASRFVENVQPLAAIVAASTVALAGCSPVLPRQAVPQFLAAGFEPRPPIVTTQPVPEALSPLRGWQPGPNRERGAETAPPLVFKPTPGAYPALYGWRPGPNRERGAETAPPVVFTAAPNSDAVIATTRRSFGQHVSAEALVALSSLSALAGCDDVSFSSGAPAPFDQCVPLPGMQSAALAAFSEASQAPYGWRPGTNRDRGAETQPPVVFTAVAEAHQPRQGWRAPPRHRDAEPIPPQLFPPVAESNQAATTGWRFILRGTGVDPVPPLVFTAAFESLGFVKWPAPPVRDRRGFDPLPAASSLPTFAPPGDVPAPWRQALRSFPHLSGCEAPPPPTFVSPPLVSPAPQRQPRTSFAIGAECQRGIVAAGLTAWADASVTYPRPARAPQGATPDAYPSIPAADLGEATCIQRAWSSRVQHVSADAHPRVPSAAAVEVASPTQRAARTQFASTTTPFAALALTAWGYEPLSSLTSPRRVFVQVQAAPLGSVTIYQLRPWIWEETQLTKWRTRSHGNEPQSIVVDPLILQSEGPFVGQFIGVTVNPIVASFPTADMNPITASFPTATINPIAGNFPEFED